ncbi:MAG: hypothetical protein ACOC42_03315, partial [Halobacteriota archaeon]
MPIPTYGVGYALRHGSSSARARIESRGYTDAVRTGPYAPSACKPSTASEHGMKPAQVNLAVDLAYGVLLLVAIG